MIDESARPPFAVLERRGALARLRPYRVEVRDVRTGSAITLRSAALATRVAELLNEAEAGRLPARVATDSPFKRYACLDEPRGFALVRSEGAFIDRIRRTADGELCRRVAELLNRVDPAKRVRVRRIGWW